MVGDADCGSGAARLNPLVLFGVLTICWIGHDGFWLLDLGSAGETTALQILLWPLIKRCWYDLRSNALPPNLDLQRSAHRCRFRRHISQCNILLKKRRRRPTGDISNLTAVVIQHFIPVASDAAFGH